MAVPVCTRAKHPSEPRQQFVNFNTYFSYEIVTFFGFNGLIKTWRNF